MIDYDDIELLYDVFLIEYVFVELQFFGYCFFDD